MALTIDAPEIEHRLQEEAQRRGMAVEEYLMLLLQDQWARTDPVLNWPISLVQDVERSDGTTPFYATATTVEWLNAFDRWIDSHTERSPLPENAFDRSSFYEEHP